MVNHSKENFADRPDSGRDARAGFAEDDEVDCIYIVGDNIECSIDKLAEDVKDVQADFVEGNEYTFPYCDIDPKHTVADGVASSADRFAYCSDDDVKYFMAG